MIGTGEIKKGVTVEVDGNLYQVIEVQHVKTKRSAVYKVKLKDLRAGHIIERSFNASEKLASARVERLDMQYLYGDVDGLTFMNTQTFEQFTVPRNIAGHAVDFIKEGDVLQVLLYGEEALGVELPSSVTLKITRSDPGAKGDTATGATKPATMETGLVVDVPLFINEGDTIKVSTSTRGYIERVATA